MLQMWTDNNIRHQKPISEADMFKTRVNPPVTGGSIRWKKKLFYCAKMLHAIINRGGSTTYFAINHVMVSQWRTTPPSSFVLQTDKIFSIVTRVLGCGIRYKLLFARNMDHSSFSFESCFSYNLYNSIINHIPILKMHMSCDNCNYRTVLRSGNIYKFC